MIKNIQIFDLDGTVIDSSHRQLYDPITGALDLAHWVEKSSHKNVMKDSLLPLAEFWHKLLRDTNDYIMICTARVMDKADFEFLEKHGLYANKIYSRPNGNTLGDAILKVMQLRSFLNLQQFKNASTVMYDDNASVRQAVRQIGITAIHPNNMGVSNND